MAINFPSSPTNGQIFYDPISGNRYFFDSVAGRWIYAANNEPFPIASDKQVLFNNAGGIDGNAGLVFDPSSNTVSANIINVTTVRVNGSVIPTGDHSNAHYVVSNAAFDKANSANLLAYETGIGANNYAGAMANAANAYTEYSINSSNTFLNNLIGERANASNVFISSVYDITNAAFQAANAEYTFTNAVYAAVNSAFDVINSTFTQSNTDNVRLSAAYISSNAAYILANAAFEAANAAYGNANSIAISANNYAGAMVNSANAFAAATYVLKAGDTISGDLSVTGNLNVLGASVTHSSNNFIVTDPLVLLASNNTADIVDIGFIAHYANATNDIVHTGFYRDHESKEWFIFKEYNVHALDYDGHIGTSGNNFTVDVLNASLRTSNLNLGGANAITWISSGYGVANAAFGRANTALQNTTGVLAGSLTTTGSLSSNNLIALAQNGAGEGGEIRLVGSGSNPDWIIDSVNTTLRHFPSAPGVQSVMFFNPFGGANSVYMTVDGYISTNQQYRLPSQFGTELGSTEVGFMWHTSGPVLTYIGSNDYIIKGSGADKFRVFNSGSYSLAYGSMRSPIFYDSDNTAFYVNPASTSVLSDLTVGGSAVVPKIAASYTLGNDPLGTSGNTWGWDNAIGAGLFNLYAGGTASTYTGTRGAARIGLHDNSINFYVSPLASGGGQASGTSLTWTHLAAWSTGGMYMYYNIYTPNIYDSNDTAYYIDPNSTTRLNALTLVGNITPSTQSNSGGGSWSLGSSAWGGNCNGGYNSVTGIIYSGGSGSQLFTMSSGPGQTSLQVDGSLYAGDSPLAYNPFGINGSSNGFIACNGGMSSGGIIYSNASMRTPIFYDLNDTGYYVDPNSVSYLYEPRMAYRTLIGYQSYDGTLFDGDTNHRPGIIIKGRYPHIDICSSLINNSNHGPTLRFMAYDTGDAVSGNFKHWVIGCPGTDAVSLGFGYAVNDGNPHSGFSRNYGNVMWFQNDYHVYVTNDCRAQSFVDRNDTGYYCNPNGTSNMYRLNLQNYLYVYGGAASACEFVGGWGTYGKVIQLRTDGAGAQDGPQIWFHKQGAKWWGIGIAPYSGANWFSFYEDGGNTSWGTERFRFDQGGTLYATGNIVAYWSDRRLKKDVVTLDNAIEIVKKLRGVSFAWNERGKEVFNASDERETGFIAQEVQQLIPSAVRENKLGQAEDGTNYLTIDQDKIVPYLVEAIKEQQAQIDELKRRLENN